MFYILEALLVVVQIGAELASLLLYVYSILPVQQLVNSVKNLVW